MSSSPDKADKSQSNENTGAKGGGGRGNRRGGGRGRGRGGRGGGRGRGRGRGRHQVKNEQLENAQKTNTSGGETINENSNSTLATEWLLDSLQNLGHFDPSSVGNSIEISEEFQEAADEQLGRLTLWLEDRLIRTWNLEERKKLRNDFWNHIDEYLDALECPQSYLRSETHDKEGDIASWRLSSAHRIQVVNWLIACATAEAFEDISGQPLFKPAQAKVTTTTTSSDVASPQSQSSSTSSATLCMHELSDFPLGFSTGDGEVDRILSFLRMKLLIELEHDQKQINDAISQLQRVTAGKAKPLKETKLKKHNPNPPKRSNKKKGKS